MLTFTHTLKYSRAPVDQDPDTDYVGGCTVDMRVHKSHFIHKFTGKMPDDNKKRQRRAKKRHKRRNKKRHKRTPHRLNSHGCWIPQFTWRGPVQGRSVSLGPLVGSCIHIKSFILILFKLFPLDISDFCQAKSANPATYLGSKLALTVQPSPLPS